MFLGKERDGKNLLSSDALMEEEECKASSASVVWQYHRHKSPHSLSAHVETVCICLSWFPPPPFCNCLSIYPSLKALCYSITFQYIFLNWNTEFPWKEDINKLHINAIYNILFGPFIHLLCNFRRPLVIKRFWKLLIGDNLSCIESSIRAVLNGD